MFQHYQQRTTYGEYETDYSDYRKRVENSNDKYYYRNSYTGNHSSEYPQRSGNGAYNEYGHENGWRHYQEGEDRRLKSSERFRPPNTEPNRPHSPPDTLNYVYVDDQQEEHGLGTEGVKEQRNPPYRDRKRTNMAAVRAPENFMRADQTSSAAQAPRSLPQRQATLTDMMRPQSRDRGAPKEAVSKNSRLVPAEQTYAEATRTAARPPVKETSKNNTHQKVANRKTNPNQRRKKTQRENQTNKTVDKDEELVILPTITGPKKRVAKQTPPINLSEPMKKQFNKNHQMTWK
jgi:hypothetical protein